MDLGSTSSSLGFSWERAWIRPWKLLLRAQKVSPIPSQIHGSPLSFPSALPGGGILLRDLLGQAWLRARVYLSQAQPLSLIFPFSQSSSQARTPGADIQGVGRADPCTWIWDFLPKSQRKRPLQPPKILEYSYSLIPDPWQVCMSTIP